MKLFSKTSEAYGRLFATLERMETERRIRAPVADAIRFIALTGCRRSEAACLRWGHVDLKQGRVVLPPQSHKTGRKTGKPREIVLPAAAQSIIARQSEGGPDDFVFAPARGDGAIALSKAWRKVRKEAELPPALGLHGLRHSIASHLAMSGAQAPEIMTAMGHRQLSTVQRYIHFAESARHALAERAAAVPLSGMSKEVKLAKPSPADRACDEVEGIEIACDHYQRHGRSSSELGKPEYEEAWEWEWSVALSTIDVATVIEREWSVPSS